ncbi:hypothetical protein KM043_005226 [Ampulex compressa]|nr:hypothetical protein KM043_005226 [Ampulex compressa]
MPPKRKPASTEGKQKRDESSWRAILDSTSINDDHWWCMVGSMVETISDQAQRVSLFEAAAEEGSRRAICSLSRRRTMASVRALAKQNPDKCPVIQGVCHYANKALSEHDGQLPAWLMARVVKYLIYRAKAESVARIKSEAELEAREEEEYRTMETVADLDKGRTTGPAEVESKSKANTRLRKRGEEWRDAIFLDDGPLDGPNLYVVLTGFHEPELLPELISAGVPLTCVLRLEGPARAADGRGRGEALAEDPREGKRLDFFEGYEVEQPVLSRFWSFIEERLMDRAYRDIAFLTVPTLETPGYDDYAELEEVDMYDRVSLAMYRTYDLYRQHANYLRCTRIEKRIARNTEEAPDSGLYADLLEVIPQEYVSVPIVLSALLLQVEANLDKEGESLEGNLNAPRASEGETNKGGNSGIAMADVASLIREKLRMFDLKYELDGDSGDGDIKSREPLNLELILHGDALNMVSRYLRATGKYPKYLEAKELDLADVVLRVLRCPRLAQLWRDREELSAEKVEKYSFHIRQIAGFFETESKPTEEEVVHHLHILMFDKMIHGSSTMTNGSGDFRNEHTFSNRLKKRKIDSRDKPPTESSPRPPPLAAPEARVKSLPALSPISQSGASSRSDAYIDHNKYRDLFSDCSPLFDSIDPRELLAPGYLRENVLARRQDEGLVERDTCELLSSSVFPQILQDCFSRFEELEARYCEPTDSMLLRFFDGKIEEVHEEVVPYGLRTAVGLREFCQHVVLEERDWLAGQGQEVYGPRWPTGRLMKSAAEEYRPMIFGDEHFILPGSLKGRGLPRAGDFQDFFEAPEPTVRKARREEAAKQKAGRITREKRRERGGGEIDTSFLPSRKVLSFECAAEGDPYVFLGYDLGGRSVRITDRAKRFLFSDGTKVRLVLQEWLYEEKSLRIAVGLRGCDLRLFRRISGSRIPDFFHLTTANGIVLGFSKITEESSEQWTFILLDVSEDSIEDDWRHPRFDFQASWPTGLCIKPTTGDAPENPFYIRQWYVPGSAVQIDASEEEICRKFLRNGTVLKYLRDGRIVVLRPNGAIVTCTGFEEAQSGEQVEAIGESNLRKETVKDPIDEGNWPAEEGVQVHDSESRRSAVRGGGRSAHGTRITSGYVIEDRLVTCNAIEERLGGQLEAEGSGTRGEDVPSGSSKLTEDGSAGSREERGGETSVISIEDGFVSVLLTCRIEHKNYATVSYDPSAVSCALSMPADLRVSISRGGHYEVSMADEVNLKRRDSETEDGGLTLTNNACATCNGRSTSAYAFSSTLEDPTRTIFTSRDPAGCVLEVKADGSMEYRGKDGRKIEEKPGRDEEGTELRGGDDLDRDTSDNGEARSVEERAGRRGFSVEEQEWYCESHDVASRGQYRIFAMNRDLTAYEYLHRSARLEQEVAAVSDNERSVIQYPIPRRPELRRLITFEPLELESRSKASRQPHQFTGQVVIAEITGRSRSL